MLLVPSTRQHRRMNKRPSNPADYSRCDHFARTEARLREPVVNGEQPVADALDESLAELTAVWGSAVPSGTSPRVLGLFAHPDDEVFCFGGTIARCAEAGAVTAILSLTQGEAGQIRDAATATRRVLGAVRVKELEHSADALGVDHVTCLDLGDGRLSEQPLELIATARAVIDSFRPHVVITFGPDGAFDHPDHVASCLATIEAIRAMAEPPRLLHARFPMRGPVLVDVIVKWLTSHPQRFIGTAAFGHAFKLFADGSSMLGFAADHIRVEWFPAGSFIIEQGEPATELFCILSGSAAIVVESDDGAMCDQATIGAGCFIGEDGLSSGQPRNAHVIACDDVTCLVLAPEQPSRSAGRGAAAVAPAAAPRPPVTTAARADVEDCFAVDVRSALDRKVAALAAHRSQYAMDRDLLPRSMLEPLLGTEHFVVAAIPQR
jgi:LmbE family N-acetylglucosaminyl deacetylase